MQFSILLNTISLSPYSDSAGSIFQAVGLVAGRPAFAYPLSIATSIVH